MIHGRQSQLPLGRGGAADGSDLAVGPVLIGDPIQRVVAIGAWKPEDLPLTLREELPALVLDDVGVAVLHRLDQGLQPPLACLVEVVGGAHEDRRQRTLSVLRSVDIGRETNAVAHRHHHLLLDGGDLVELSSGASRPLRHRQRRSDRAATDTSDGKHGYECFVHGFPPKKVVACQDPQTDGTPELLCRVRAGVSLAAGCRSMLPELNPISSPSGGRSCRCGPIPSCTSVGPICAS